MSAIVRMNRTYNMLDRKTKERLEFLRVVMATEKNYGAYREALRNASQPSLPFLGTLHFPMLHTFLLLDLKPSVHVGLC